MGVSIKKSSGITAVYRESTEAVSTVFEALNLLALSAKALAQQAEMSAQISRAEAVDALVTTLGEDGIKKLQTAEELMKALRSM
jgi:hypothetical protein